MQFSSIKPIDRALSGATIPGLSGPGSNGNKGVLCIPQSSSITGASPLDCLVSYLEHLLGVSYPSAEKQSVYSIAPVDWAKSFCANLIIRLSLLLLLLLVIVVGNGRGDTSSNPGRD